MAAKAEEVHLLFFDTFYHEQNKEELNLDLIQFSQPVLVYELRVIPLKTQVEPNLGKGCRLGGTLPSEFKLEVFANNLDKPTSSTFEKLGQLDYKENKNIQLKLDRHVPTDGLILKGWYRAVTLAVYGCVTVVMPPHDSPPPPPPPLSAYQLAQSKTKIPGLELSDEETHKPVTQQQQHPLDYINEQVQKVQQQQHYTSSLPSSSSSSVQSLIRDPHKPPALEDSFVEVLRKPSPRRERDAGSNRDRDRASSRDQDLGSSRERGSSHDRGRDSYNTNREKDTFDAGRDRDTFDAGRDRDKFDAGRDRDTFDVGRDRDTFEASRDRDTFDVGRDRDTFDASRDRDTFDASQDRDTFDVGRDRDTFDASRDRDTFDDSRDRDTFDGDRETFDVDRDTFDAGRDNRDTFEIKREDSHDRSRGYDFPPEPKEPYDVRDKDVHNDDFRPRSRDHDGDFVVRNVQDEDRPRSREQERDREYAARRDRMGHHDSRDSDGRDSRVSHSREGSREPREHPGESPVRDTSRDDYLREQEIEVDREAERLKELEEKEREQKETEAKEKKKREQELLEREMKEKEHEKELQKEREREREIKKEKEAREREREQREKEREKELEKEREKELKEKELEKKKEKEREKEREKEKEREFEREKEKEREFDKEKDKESDREKEREKEMRIKDRYDHDWPSRTRSPPSHLGGSRSRSNSRSRRVSRSRHRSRSRSKPRTASKVRSKSRSPQLEPPPVPSLSEEEEAEEEEVEEEEETEEQEIYDSMSDPASSRRQRRVQYDADAQEVEEGYEDISSDDEIGAMEDPNMMQVLDLYELEEEHWEGPQVFNPFDFYLAPMLQLKSPALSCYEIELSRCLSMDKSQLERPKEAKLLLDIVSKFTDTEHQDRWVMAMEEIPALLDKGLSYLLTHDHRHDVLDVLTAWVVEGCDPDIAMTQPDAAIKVRHLKIGIKLAGHLGALSENIALVLLRKGIQSKLLDLFESQFIVFSVKHLALRSLASTTHFPAGMQWLLGIHPESKVKDIDETGYQRLIRSLLEPKIVKLTMSVTALLRKVHFFESLINLYCITERILSSTSQSEEAALHKQEEEDEAPQLQAEDEKKILANLEEVTKILGDAHGLIGQLHDAVPYNLLVDNHAKSADTLQAVYNVAGYCHLLETVFALLSCPVTASSPNIYLSIHTLMQQFMSSQHGLLFLCAHAETTSGIIRCLLQAAEETEDSGEDFPSRQLGLELVYHIQLLQFIDQLVHRAGAHARGNRLIDDPEVISVLHGLYSMTFTTVCREPLMGRHIMAKVLAYDNNLESLLPFLEKTGDEEADKQLRKSVCANYCIQLLLTAIKTCPSVTMLERYGQRLLALSQDSTSAKLTQLQEWLAPVKKVTSFDLDGLATMISQLKVYTDDVKKVPPGLITVIRMIYSLVAEAAANASVDCMDTLNEARYRYALVELYSAECYPIFINILQKLSESQLKVWQQGIPYTTDQWLTYFSLIKPTLSLVHATLCQLIQAFTTEGGKHQGSQDDRAEGGKSQGTKEDGAEGGKPQGPQDDHAEDNETHQEPLVLNSFKDLTSVATLLELHTVMCSVPTSSLYNSDLTKIQKDIVDTLLAFTQEDLQQTQTDDALSKSLWTLMLKELLKYTIKAPYTYMSGLLVVSELLPLPFPLHTKSPLTVEEMDAAVMARKLWSVHLQSATPELFAVLDTVSGTGCQPLQHLMRRVCWQIADLAAPSSLRVTKILLDILMLNLKPKKPTQTAEGEQKEGDDDMTAVRTVSIHTAKTLNLLAYLLSHPGIKAALLQLIGSSINSDAKYNDFLPIMLQLLNQAAETPAEIQAQEGIVSMIQNLCDLEISMVNTDLPVTLAQHLANSLPESVLMADIVTALFEHIGNATQSYASILPCLRTLIMLTDHDYGFFHIKISLERNVASIHTLLNRINTTFSKDNSDCLSALSDVLEFLRLLTTIDVGEDVSLTRTKVLSQEDLRHFLLWGLDARHPLEELEGLSREEESLETILESITTLTSILRNSSPPTDGDTNLEEIILPVPAPLTELFNQRAIYTILDTEDERLSPSYWLANPAVDEPDAKPEVLRCDLQAICELHLPDFNLEQELKKETSSAEDDIVRPKRPKDRRISHEVININRGKPGRFVAPMRGRGIISHGMMMPNRNNDPFRARASNTSRPPSMHVDDFVKMENSQQQPATRPPQTPPMVPVVRESGDKELRGRTNFDQGPAFGLRNRYFAPPASYRQDLAMHDGLPLPGAHSSHRGGSRGGLLDRPRGNFIAPRPFARGHDRQGPLQMDRHGTRNGRFSPGGRGGRGGQWGRGRDMGEGGRFAGGGFRGRRDGNRHVRSFTK